MVLVTGGAGYIGSQLNKLLFESGYETIVIDNLVHGHSEAVKWGRLEIADLSDVDRLEAIFENYAFDTVFHLAGYAYVGESVENPAKYYRNNVANTINLGWLDSWQKRGWTRKGGDVKNPDLWKKLIPLLETHKVSFVWIKGHAENEYNNRCDELAVTESRKY